MKKLDEFLEVVDEGKAVDILSEDKVTEKFNESLKHDLVKVEKDKVSLTSKGKRARNKGTRQILKQEDQKDETFYEVTDAGIKRGRILAGIAMGATFLIFFLTIRYILNQ